VLRERPAAGFDHLALVTDLLQRARCADALGGTWEAADFQWNWRRDQHPDPAASTFWLDDADRPVLAVVLTDWGDRLGCDILDAHHDSAAALTVVWPTVLAALDRHADRQVETAIRVDDEVLIDAMSAVGFAPTDELAVTTVMPASERPAVPALPPGFALASRVERAELPHHLIGRSGADVAARLAECSLYRPDLDLCIVDTESGAVAAYGVFWADLVTGIGLVEPMRTENAYQRRGLASIVLREGLDRLAAAGCPSLRVIHMFLNDRARRLYMGAGFRPALETRTYGREPRASAGAS
jgi:ribosomal protein S18 acetylase RimI-like enzyme